MVVNMPSYINFSPNLESFVGKRNIQQGVCIFCNSGGSWGAGDKGGMVGPWLQPPENALLKLNVIIKMILVIFFWLCDRTFQSQFKTYEILEGLLLSGDAPKWKFFIDWKDCTIEAGVSYEHSRTQSEHVKPKRKQRPALSERFCKC